MSTTCFSHVALLSCSQHQQAAGRTGMLDTAPTAVSAAASQRAYGRLGTAFRMGPSRCLLYMILPPKEVS